jgi:hypothetical protein
MRRGDLLPYVDAMEKNFRIAFILRLLPVPAWPDVDFRFYVGSNPRLLHTIKIWVN